MPQTCPKCAKDLDASHDAFCAKCRFPLMPIGEHYRIDSRLASGGFGLVYIGTDLRDERLVAIKVIKFEDGELESDQYEQLTRRFFREALVTQKLSQLSEHIVRIFDHGEDPNYGLFYVMELLRGTPLDRMTGRGQRNLPIREALSIFRQLCEGIKTAHQNGIVHRDLKPDNIFLIEKGEELHFVKILDFGIAKKVSGTMETQLTKGVVGTPHYFSPEQCTGEAITPQADIYSMGVLLFELLTGELPFQGSSPMALITSHVMKPPPAVSQRRPELNIPAAFDQIIAKAMAKMPEERYDSVEQFWRAVEPFETSYITPIASNYSLNEPLPTPATPNESLRPRQPEPKASEASLEIARAGLLAEVHDSAAFAPTHDQLDAVPLNTQEREALQPKRRRRPEWIAVISGMVACLFLGGLWKWSSSRAASKASMQKVKLADADLPGAVHARSALPATPSPQLHRPGPPPRPAPQRRIQPRAKAPSLRPVVRRRPKRRRRWRRKSRRKRPVARRLAAPREPAGPCGNDDSSWRWIAGYFVKPTLSDTRTEVRLLGCAACQVRKRPGLYCLRVPKGRRLRAQIKAQGFQTCRHRISPSQRRIRWKLKLTDPDSLATDEYKCSF